MGGGTFDADLYRAAASARRKKGEDDFAYDKDVKSKPIDERKAHPLLDPYGLTFRESRDSEEHPNSVAIIVPFDETGSMRTQPGVFQKKLSDLMALVKERAGIKDPQICVGALGDYYSDQVPFQIGQFESDNRIDEQLRNIFLEGGGGGSMEESYGLAHYFAGWKTSIDCWEKRRKKGYLFTTGDEKPYNMVTREEIIKIFGDTLERDLTIEEAVAKASEMYEVFHIVATRGSYGRNSGPRWVKLLGQRVLFLDDPNSIAELIASTIALTEGEADPDDPTAGMGLDDATARSVNQALMPYSKSLALTKVGSVSGKLPEPPKKKGGLRKL